MNTIDEHTCLCSDARAFEHEVRKIAGALITDRRRFLLRGMNGAILEGSIRFFEHDGTLEVKVDGSNVNELLHHYYKEGDRVRIVVMPVGPGEEEESES